LWLLWENWREAEFSATEAILGSIIGELVYQSFLSFRLCYFDLRVGAAPDHVSR
jgi:hypothetical protein